MTRFLITLISIIGVVYTTSSLAVIPVVDFGEMTKTVEVYRQLTKQYGELKQQYYTMQATKQALSGQSSWGGWNNSYGDLVHEREWDAGSWQSTLHGMAGGNQQRYQQLMNQYQANHHTMTQSAYQKGSDQHLSQAYQNQVQVNQASATNMTYEFNTIHQHLKTLYQLSQQISGKGNTDVKSAIDLNSRIEIEVAYISTEILRMQTVLGQQMAAMSAHNIALENETSQFNQAGEN